MLPEEGWFPMTNTLLWHSTVATDRPLYPVGFVSASAIVSPLVAVVWLPTMTVAQRVNRVLLLLLCLLAAIGFTWVFAWPW
jgi:hypothetical protein